MPDPTQQTRMVLDVDLTGSRLGSTWRSVRVEVMLGEWTPERLRKEAARHYGVPLNQVTDPWPKTWADDEGDRDDLDGPWPCIDHGIVGCGDCERRHA